MCLAIPMRLVERKEVLGTAELHGVRREIGLLLCPEVQVGDWLLVHAGFAIGAVDEAEAEATLAVLERMSAEVPS